MVGRESVGMIRANLAKGQGVDGKLGPVKKFKQVTKDYAEHRNPSSSLAPKKGKKGNKTRKSRLIHSGKMFRDMTWKALNFSAKLKFRTEESAKIAQYHDKDGAGKSKILRPFFNLSKAQFNLIQREMKKFIDKNLKK